MAIRIMELHHVGLRIPTDPDGFEATRRFYEEVMGVTADKARPDFSDLPGFWMNVGENNQVHLMAMEGASARAKSPDKDPSLPHVAYGVEDILEAKAELERLEVDYWTLDALGDADARMQIFFSDPGGNLIELHQYDICRCTARRRLAPE